MDSSLLTADEATRREVRKSLGDRRKRQQKDEEKRANSLDDDDGEK